MLRSLQVTWSMECSSHAAYRRRGHHRSLSLGFGQTADRQTGGGFDAHNASTWPKAIEKAEAAGFSDDKKLRLRGMISKLSRLI